MGKLIAAIILSFVACSSVYAQPTRFDRLTPPLPTQNERKIADIASWGTVLTAIALDTRASWKSENRSRALKAEASRLLTTWGIASVVKHSFERERPCAPDCGIDSPDSSLYSLHTAFAFSTLGGPGWKVEVPLTVGTAGLRIGAGKHWLTDTIAGAVAGAVASRIR